MARYLVVAHQTVTSPELLKQVRVLREQEEDAEFVLLVPATPVRRLLFRRGDEHDAEATARKLAERGRALFAKKGLPLHDAKVGAPDPAVAIDREVMADSGYTGFVISTLPPRRSPGGCAWTCRVRSSAKYGLPVHHVVAAPEFSLADLP